MRRHKGFLTLSLSGVCDLCIVRPQRGPRPISVITRNRSVRMESPLIRIQPLPLAILQGDCSPNTSGRICVGSLSPPKFSTAISASTRHCDLHVRIAIFAAPIACTHKCGSPPNPAPPAPERRMADRYDCFQHALHEKMPTRTKVCRETPHAAHRTPGDGEPLPPLRHIQTWQLVVSL